VLEDPSLQLVQLRTGLKAELVDEPAAGRLKQLKRVGLAAGAVEREHQRRYQALARRTVGHELLELSDELPAVSRRGPGLDPRLERAQPQLVEPPAIAERRGLIDGT